ncbi:MAG TPA: DUF4258 domain-containing protein [Blastocatellia bacterium]|nr:DUF4258 domain-containing protein [Blastocatellia bacterium]
MQIGNLHISKHAVKRMAQRNVSVPEMATVVSLGRVKHRAGATFFFLGRRDVPEGRMRELEKLIGTTVVITGNEILTVYRNRRALSSIKRKLKRLSRQKNQGSFRF